MSTNDVPGARAENHDELAMGCWAEHPDGSMIFVQSNENGRVVFSLFDTAREPPLEWRDAMPEDEFKKTFSWNDAKPTRTRRGSVPNERWTWHDKTPFPWENVIKRGAKDGPIPQAADIRSAAERVAEALDLDAAEVDADAIRDMAPSERRALRRMVEDLKDKLDDLGI